MESNTRFNWSFLLWIIGLMAFWTVVGAVTITVLCGCATKRELHEHQTHNIVADSMATESRADVHTSVSSQFIDSLVQQSVQRFRSEWSSHADERETVTETITTAIDSLGRQLRTEQRTTTRNASRDEQRRDEQTVENMRLDFQHRIQQQDSVWQQRFAELRTHMQDSLSAVRDLATQTSPTIKSPLQRLWDSVRNIAFYLCVTIGIALWWTRRKQAK